MIEATADNLASVHICGQAIKVDVLLCEDLDDGPLVSLASLEYGGVVICHSILPFGVRRVASVGPSYKTGAGDLSNIIFGSILFFMKRTNRQGFDLALSHFYIKGERHGAKAAMAKALGCTRAAVDVWETAGIPIKHIAALKKLTGLKGSQMLPELADLLD